MLLLCCYSDSTPNREHLLPVEEGADKGGAQRA